VPIDIKINGCGILTSKQKQRMRLKGKMKKSKGSVKAVKGESTSASSVQGQLLQPQELMCEVSMAGKKLEKKGLRTKPV